MDRLGNLLGRVLARQPGSAHITELRMQLAFREVLGDSLAAACQRIEVRGTTVHVGTANPALAHQLRLDSELLIQRLNRETQLGRKVRAIKVQTGR